MSELIKWQLKLLPGIGAKKADVIREGIGAVNCEELLYHFPYKWVDRTRIIPIKEIDPNAQFAQIRGKFNSLRFIGEGKGRRLVGNFFDETGSVEVVWFQGHKYVTDNIDPRVEYILFAKPAIFNGKINFSHPELDKVILDEPITLGWQAFYFTTEKMKSGYVNSKFLQRVIFQIFKSYHGAFPETLPDYLIKRFALMPLTEAMRQIHFPDNSQLLDRARFRFIFEELFYIQINTLRLRSFRLTQLAGSVFGEVGEVFNTFYAQHLPFSLTNAQKRVVKEMRRDMGSGRQMNRLLQGDVGSGKTLVALLVMLLAVDNKFQACMMAPTEILANQHFDTISKLLKGMDLKIGILTGSSRKKQREVLHSGLQEGTIQLLIGTHALLEDSVVFNNLGLVVIDEQHRFGVEQRSRLWTKNHVPPHILVMTATPIPRTLAMTLYGDLDVSVIDELPPGRKPISTQHRYHSHRKSLNEFVRQELLKGRQVYVVYPLIEQSERSDYKNLEEGFLYMEDAFPEFKVCMVHGKMKPKEKDEAMKRFAKGETHIMVATTVIEVGVNVPNASVMIIESAERFGLSQLHQLRGRVGRGADQSYCILMTDFKLGADSRERMAIMVRTNDGFEIAEADLKMRGHGDLEGTQQSGSPYELKIANLGRDSHIIQPAREIAMQILDADPLLSTPENTIIRQQIDQMNRLKDNWRGIS